MFPATTRILLVEDVPLRERVAKNILTGAGYTNLTQLSDLAAIWLKLQQAAHEKRPFGLLIVDWDNVNPRSLAALHRLRPETPLPPVTGILLTANADRDHVLAAIRSGFQAYLAKPFTSDALLEKLREVWQNSHKAA